MGGTMPIKAREESGVKPPMRSVKARADLRWIVVNAAFDRNDVILTKNLDFDQYLVKFDADYPIRCGMI